MWLRSVLALEGGISRMRAARRATTVVSIKVWVSPGSDLELTRENTLEGDAVASTLIVASDW
jgi:hypothetical protein